MRPRRLIVAAVLAAVAAVAVGGAVAWRSARRPPPEQRFRAGLDAIDRKDAAAAAEAIESLRDEPGFDARRHLLEAKLRLRSGNPRGALEELTYVPATGELKEPVYLLKGEAFYLTGRLTEAEQILLRLDALHPDLPDVCRWLAAIYYDLGAMHDAVARLEQLAKLAPNDYSPHRMLGLIHLDFERYSQSVDHYREALRLSPPKPLRQELARDLARALVQDRRYDEALTALKDATPDAAVLNLRAECLWNLSDRAAAGRAWEEAHRLAPDDRAVLFFGARMRLDEGRADDALPLLERILKKDPHDTEARYQLGMAYRRLGRAEDSQRELDRKQASQELRDRLAQLSIKAMDEPRNAEIRDELAEVCRELGKDELVAMWRKAAEDCRSFQRLGK